MVQYVMTVFVSSTPAASNTARSVSGSLSVPSSRRSESMGTCTAPGTCPERPVSSVAPDGQNRSLMYSSRERTSSTRYRGSPMADSTSCREARTSELGAERTYEVSDGSDTFVVHALPASVHRLRDSAMIRTSLSPYVLSSQNPSGAL